MTGLLEKLTAGGCDICLPAKRALQGDECTLHASAIGFEIWKQQPTTPRNSARHATSAWEAGYRVAAKKHIEQHCNAQQNGRLRGAHISGRF
jgi:hypothetical protein